MKKDTSHPGKVLIFRWTRKCPKTGRIIRAKGHPFPLWVDAKR